MGHDTLDVDSYEYWDFSFQDLTLDALASLTYIHNLTGKKIQYLGHSQGTTMMFAGLADTDKELAANLASKISVFHAICPVVLFVSSI